MRYARKTPLYLSLTNENCDHTWFVSVLLLFRFRSLYKFFCYLNSTFTPSCWNLAAGSLPVHLWINCFPNWCVLDRIIFPNKLSWRSRHIEVSIFFIWSSYKTDSFVVLAAYGVVRIPLKDQISKEPNMLKS